MNSNIKKTIKNCLPHGIIEFRKNYSIKNILNNFRKSFSYLPIRENSVLLIEFFSFHGEVLPGFTKYLLDLGYNVDIILNEKGGKNDSGLFSCFNENDRVRVKTLPYYNMNLLLRSSIVEKYKHTILSSFYDRMIYNHLYKVDLFKLKPVCVMHNYDINNEYFNTNKKISLTKMDYLNRKNPLVVNAHYFGEFKKKEKADKSIFFTLNTTDIDRRNLYLLFSACDRLYEKGISNFSVKIIGNGIPIPERFHKNFEILGYLNFQEMYKEIETSDFILALIDQAAIQYTNKASGSYQLSYGFLKPIVLHKKFSEVSGFTDKNSILYDDNDHLVDAIERCIYMSKDDYSSLVNGLEISEKNIYETSLNNLKEALESPI